jgi:hypothetical protein
MNRQKQKTALAGGGFGKEKLQDSLVSLMLNVIYEHAHELVAGVL